MEISFNETKRYRRYPRRWSAVILSLVSLAFLVSDWAILYSSFGDFLLAFAVLLIFLLGKLHIQKKQMSALLILFSVLALTFILSYFYNDYWFNLQRAVLSLVKLVFYAIALAVIYNYIKQNQLSGTFLRLNNVLAIGAVVIGLILTVCLYLDYVDLPRLFWTFTRQDTKSYLYAGNEAIIRTRSIFSEPAHLGYYLNTLFFANVVDKKTETKKTVVFILAAGILLTLSYSMILIFAVTGLTLLVSRIFKGDLAWTYWYLVPVIVLGGLVAYFWEFIDVTIVERTRNILSGEDGSANVRLFGAWEYVERNRLLMGNGIGHTPPITNIYAYILSDFGLIGFIPYLGLTLYVLLNSLPAFIFFFMMNMAKGGYLNPAFWLFLLFVFLYGVTKEQQDMK